MGAVGVMPMGKARSARRMPAVACVVLAAIVALTAFGSGISARLDALLYDAESAAVRAVAPVPAEGVVLVGIDQATVDAIAAPIALWHSELGAALGAIAKGGPRLVAVDVVLPERSMNAFGTGLDIALLKGIVSARSVNPAGGIVLALQPDAAGGLRPIYPPYVAAAGQHGAGAAAFRIEVDGAVRFVDPDISTFTSAIARRLERPTPVGYIDYTRGDGFHYVPLIEVLQRGRAEDSAWLVQQFADKVIVVGSVLPLLDRRQQPVALAAWEPGHVEPPATLIHAQAIRTLLAGTFIRELPLAASMALALAFALLALVPGTIARWLTLGAAIAGSFVAASWGLRAGWHAPLATPWVAGVAAAVARSAFDGWHFLRERDRLARLFEGYVSPQVFRGVMAGDLAGRGRGTLAILFADVRGFTTLTEHSAADDVLDVLNRYYSAVTPILHSHGATIDAFRGDGLNALFGAPEPQAEAAGASLRAARAMLAALVTVNESLVSEGRAPLQIGIGLACGEAVFGDVGSRDRRDFTAIGDPVNLAARLQDLTRQLDCPILLTDAMHGMLSPEEALGLTDLGVQPIKGHSAVRVWGCARLRADGQAAAGPQRTA